MNYQALVFQNTTFDIIDQAGQVWLRAAEIATALSYKNTDAITQLFERNKDEFTPSMSQTLRMKVSGNYEKTIRIFSLRGAHLLAMLARTPVAKAFRKWVLDILDRETSGTTSSTALPAPAHLDLRDEIHRVSGGVRKTRSQLFNCLYRRYRVNSYLDIPAEQCANAIEYVRSLEGDYIPKSAPSPALALPDGQHYVVAKDGVVLYHKVLSKTVGKDAMPAVEAGGLALNSIEAQQLGVALHCAVRITNVWRSHISPMLHAVKSPIPAELGDNVSSLNFVASMLSSSLYGDGYPLSHGGKALATR